MVSKYITDMKRVWKVTKKPSKKEYFLTVKIVLLGLVVIGVIGLLVEIFNVLVIKRVFV